MALVRRHLANEYYSKKDEDFYKALEFCLNKALKKDVHVWLEVLNHTTTEASIKENEQPSTWMMIYWLLSHYKDKEYSNLFSKEMIEIIDFYDAAGDDQFKLKESDAIRYFCPDIKEKEEEEQKQIEDYEVVNKTWKETIISMFYTFCCCKEAKLYNRLKLDN